MDNGDHHEQVSTTEAIINLFITKELLWGEDRMQQVDFLVIIRQQEKQTK